MNTVLCDLCNEDYSNSDRTGGFIYGSYAVCPACAPEMMRGIEETQDMDSVRAKAKPDETFKDFVLRVRIELEEPDDYWELFDYAEDDNEPVI